MVLPLYEEVFDIEYPLPKLDTLVVCVTWTHTRSRADASIGERLRLRRHGELGDYLCTTDARLKANAGGNHAIGSYYRPDSGIPLGSDLGRHCLQAERCQHSKP